MELLWNPCGTVWNLVKPYLKALMEPNLAEPCSTPQPLQNLVKIWWNPGGIRVELGWNPGGTLVEPYLKPPRTTPQLSQNLVELWWNPRGTLPQTTPDHPAALAEPGGTLVEPSWNLTSNGPPRSPCRTWWNPGGTLVEPWCNPRGTLPQTTLDHPTPRRTWWNSGGTLVEPSWNLTSNRPGPPRSPGGTLGGTLVEPWWNPRGTLPQGRPGPPRTLSGLRPQSFQLLRKKEVAVPLVSLKPRGPHKTTVPPRPKAKPSTSSLDSTCSVRYRHKSSL